MKKHTFTLLNLLYISARFIIILKAQVNLSLPVFWPLQKANISLMWFRIHLCLGFCSAKM